tara:strand:+ start:469 stop:621 length:153 start_codon:yes stop_codon:yes gene_type:complete
MNGDYPAGVEYDSKAPFNQEEIECPLCIGTGEYEEGEECRHCEGDGIIIK